VAEGLAQCAAMLKVAMEGLERVRAIVRDLKTFSRIDPEEGVMVDLHQVIDAALNVAQSELRHRARLERHYGDLAPVRGSTSRLGQVFLNLVVNGAQAIPADRRGGGLVRVATKTASDGWACIEITDDGVGIPPALQLRLFEPFHTTKPGEGTGLGLYITRTIVESHGGTIEVESTEGVGTTVRVKLPPYERTLDVRRQQRAQLE
jgi:signal transduction histidine kinase